MQAITGTVKNGQVILSEPLRWPDGSEVRVELVEAPADRDSPNGAEIDMSEVEQGDDPESIARWIAEFEAIPPLEMTPEEEAEWQAARQAQKEFEKATFHERAEQLRRMWE